MLIHEIYCNLSAYKMYDMPHLEIILHNKDIIANTEKYCISKDNFIKICLRDTFSVYNGNRVCNVKFLFNERIRESQKGNKSLLFPLFSSSPLKQRYTYKTNFNIDLQFNECIFNLFFYIANCLNLVYYGRSILYPCFTLLDFVYSDSFNFAFKVVGFCNKSCGFLYCSFIGSHIRKS